jgi:two-component system, chemotaxis family, CheB/CheR fusion protein
MITGHGDLPMAVKAMKAGAIDFLEKPIHLDQLLASIDSALELASDSTKQLALHRAATARLAGLTARQRNVLDFVLQGRPNKIIAHELGISQRTVESHRAAVMKRAGVKTLPDLIRLVIAAD